MYVHNYKTSMGRSMDHGIRVDHGNIIIIISNINTNLSLSYNSAPQTCFRQLFLLVFSHLSLSWPPVWSSLNFGNRFLVSTTLAFRNGLPKDLHQFAYNLTKLNLKLNYLKFTSTPPAPSSATFHSRL